MTVSITGSCALRILCSRFRVTIRTVLTIRKRVVHSTSFVVSVMTVGVRGLVGPRQRLASSWGTVRNVVIVTSVKVVDRTTVVVVVLCSFVVLFVLRVLLMWTAVVPDSFRRITNAIVATRSVTLRVVRGMVLNYFTTMPVLANTLSLVISARSTGRFSYSMVWNVI